jgi:ABC-type uncharacterized transport system permease subunit
MPSSSFHFITAALYALAFGIAWRDIRVLRPNSSHANAPPQSALLFACLLAGIVLHAVTLFSDLFRGDGLNIGFSHAVSLIAWLAIGAYAIIGRGNRLLTVAAMYLAPLALIAVLLPLLLPGQRIVHFGGLAFKAHVVVAVLAYALFTVAAIHALLMASLEKRLHAGELPWGLQGMPPLLRLERLLFQLLFVAFALLTATVVSGIAFSEELFGRPFQLNHKTVFALLSWGIFAGLLAGHWRFGWRGLLAIRWTLAGFVLLLLSYVGSKFVLEIVLQRP